MNQRIAELEAEVSMLRHVANEATASMFVEHGNIWIRLGDTEPILYEDAEVMTWLAGYLEEGK